MKKIIHIVEAFGGGIYTFLEDLINSTSDEFEIVIIYAEREQTPKNFEMNFNKNIKFIKSKYLQRSINFRKDIKAIKEINKIVKEEKPDIVHLHSSKAGIIGRIAVNNKNIKLLYNPHGFSFLMRNTSKIKRIIYWFIEKIAALKNCTIVACSKGEYEEAKKLSKKSICINNGINVEKLKNEISLTPNNTSNKEKIKICTSARINYQKNPILFNDISEEFPELDFTWIGDGELRNELKSKNINITGWKEKKEVLNILKENDIFILTSLWEGLPISLLEAMYMKKICIVSNSIGNRDVIKNKINGFICDNKEEFVKVISSIKNNEIDIERIKENSYNDIVNNYNIQDNCKKYIELYNN